MLKPDHTITPEQARVYEILQRVKMAWLALWVALALFTLVLAAFLYAMFALKDPVAEATSGAIELMLGWAVKAVYSNLFPSKGAPDNDATSGKSNAAGTS